MHQSLSHLKELLGLLELQGVLRGLRLSVVGRLGLVRHETVVWDHYGGREDRGGHKDGVAVDLLHGERGGDDLLLQCVYGLGEAHVALRRLRGDAASGNQRLHWLVEEHS